MTSRMGLFCYRHRWWIVVTWLVVMVGGAAVTGPLFKSMGDSTKLKGTEASAAKDAVKDGVDHGAQIVTVISHVDAHATSTTDAVNRATSDVRGISGVLRVDRPRFAADNSAVAVTITLEKSKKQFRPLNDAEARMKQLTTDLPGATVEFGGGDLISGDANKAINTDLNHAELYSLPVTLIVLIFVFGGIIAAGLPVITAVSTMLGAFLVLLGFATFTDLDSDVITVVTLLGLGLSIDYGLLLVARYREELARDTDRTAIVGRVWATAGRTIMFSALTVAAALTGLMFFQIPRLQALAAAGISTTVVAMLAALTLTAAMLRVTGRWIKPAKRRTRKGAAPEDPTRAAHGAPYRGSAETHQDLDRGFFAGLARITQRQPLLVALACIAALLAVALPLLHVTIKVPQLEGLPRTIQSVRVADELNAQFGQTTQASVMVVARMDTATLDSYAAQWANDPAVARVEKANAVNPQLSTVVLAVNGDGQGTQAQQLVARLRADRPAGVQSWVTGDAAALVDLNDRLKAGLPAAIAVTVLAMFILLYLMTGSVVIPVKAIVMNLVSLAATFGVLVAVFQKGWLSHPLDTLTVGGMSPYMIVIVFAFAFGLSMDYEVFLLSRIKEYIDAGVQPNTAVRYGLQRSGRIITSAALLMLIVFAAFASAKVGALEEIGLGLFVAVLFDATIVRCLLVPATLTLLGRAAWWAPGPLRRLHRRYGVVEGDLQPLPPAHPAELARTP